jgi:hypothetical protein
VRTAWLGRIERGLRNAVKKDLLAAVGLHALVDGLITNRVLDPKYVPLAKAAEPLVDSYLDGLKADDGKKRSTARKPRK